MKLPKYFFSIIPICLIAIFLSSDSTFSASLLKETVIPGPEEIILTAEQRSNLSLNWFHDGILSGWRNPDGVKYTLIGPNDGKTAKIVGTLSDIAQQVTSTGVSLSNPKSAYDYASGHPFYYDAQSGRWLFSYHSERWPNGATNFYSTIGLAYSQDNGDSIIDLGEIIQAEVPIDQYISKGFGAIEVQGGPIVVAPDGYFYVFFNEHSLAGQYVGISVARAPISEVVAAARNGELSQWMKYYNGSWNQVGMGGLGSRVVNPLPYTWITWCDAAWNRYLNKFVMICSISMYDSKGVFTGDTALAYASSADGIQWDPMTVLTLYPENPVRERFYPSIIGLEDGKNLKLTGKKFYVYYTNSYLGAWNRWADASVNRIKITVAQPTDFLATWDGQGVYFRNSETTKYVKLASPADLIAAGDIDGDGRDDLVGTWPGQGGVWARYSKTGTWAKLSSTAKHIAAGDMNGDGRVDLLGTWDGQGVYYRDSISGTWTKLATPATLITAGDLDGDGKDDLIGIWPSQGGVWVKYSKTGTWAKISSSARDIAAGDMNGDGRADLLGTWDGQGVFYRDSVSGAWVKMAVPEEQVTAGDLDGDGTDDLIGLYASQGGVWVKYSKSGAWSKLATPAKDIAAGIMRGAFWGSNRFDFIQLDGPIGGYAEGPSNLSKYKDSSSDGPGSWRFMAQEEKNLVPHTTGQALALPGPGEPGFMWTEQQNLVPQETAIKETRKAPREKIEREGGKDPKRIR